MNITTDQIQRVLAMMFIEERKFLRLIHDGSGDWVSARDIKRAFNMHVDDPWAELAGVHSGVVSALRALAIKAEVDVVRLYERDEPTRQIHFGKRQWRWVGPRLDWAAINRPAFGTQRIGGQQILALVRD